VAEVSARVIARRPAILVTAAILLALCVLASLFVGSSRIPAGQVAHYLLHPDASNVSYNINVLRVQRTIMGVLVGAALAVAGAVMQAVTRNPLAEPGLLGVNAGASLGIVLGTAVLGVLPVPNQLALAAGGALVATALVQVIGMIGASSPSPVRLVLIGVAFSAFAGAVIRGVVLTMPNLFRTFIDWEVGSLTRTDIPLPPVAVLVVAGTGAAILLAGALDNIALGDDVAAALGTRVALVRSLRVPPQAVARGLRDLQLAGHRIAEVAEIDGVRWIDDSKATNPHAADSAMQAFPSFVWVAGGQTKGTSFDDLITRHRDRIRAAILVGVDRQVIADALARHAPDVPVIVLDSSDHGVMDEVVSQAARLARRGDAVLLSPGSASLDMFTGYDDRGERFATAVRSLQAPSS